MTIKLKYSDEPIEVTGMSFDEEGVFKGYFKEGDPAAPVKTDEFYPKEDCEVLSGGLRWQDISAILDIDKDYENEILYDCDRIPSYEEQMSEILRRFQQRISPKAVTRYKRGDTVWRASIDFGAQLQVIKGKIRSACLGVGGHNGYSVVDITGPRAKTDCFIEEKYLFPSKDIAARCLRRGFELWKRCLKDDGDIDNDTQ